MKKKLLNKKVCYSLHSLSKTFLNRSEWDIIINAPTSPYEVPLFLSDVNETWILSTDFRKTLTY